MLAWFCRIKATCAFAVAEHYFSTTSSGHLRLQQVALCECTLNLHFAKTVKTQTIQINDRVQLKIKISFWYFLILWRPLVSIVCLCSYIIIYSGLTTKSRSATYKAASATENKWLATNFCGNHLSLCVDVLFSSGNFSGPSRLNYAYSLSILLFHLVLKSSNSV